MQEISTSLKPGLGALEDAWSLFGWIHMSLIYQYSIYCFLLILRCKKYPCPLRLNLRLRSYWRFLTEFVLFIMIWIWSMVLDTPHIPNFGSLVSLNVQNTFMLSSPILGLWRMLGVPEFLSWDFFGSIPWKCLHNFLMNVIFLYVFNFVKFEWFFYRST